MDVSGGGGACRGRVSQTAAREAHVRRKAAPQRRRRRHPRPGADLSWLWHAATATTATTTALAAAAVAVAVLGRVSRRVASCERRLELLSDLLHAQLEVDGQVEAAHQVCAGRVAPKVVPLGGRLQQRLELGLWRRETRPSLDRESGG